MDDSAESTHHSTSIDSNSYRSTPNGLIRKKLTKHGLEVIPLTNFNARIIEDICEDNGTEQHRYFQVEAVLSGQPFRLTVPAERFASLWWVLEHLGPEAVVYPGQTDHARVAIQLLSGEVPARLVLAHTGWRLFGKDWGYLHGGGAIGPRGPLEGVHVTLPRDLKRFVLLPLPTGDLRNAILASYRSLDVAPDVVVIPALASVYRAVLGFVDFSAHLVGETGQGKTAVAALMQQHFGRDMDARHLPASWGSTANALESLAFSAKDALIVVDDLVPSGSPLESQRTQRDVGRIFRAQGNVSGRQRMRADASLHAAKPPRGLILSTGEDVPRGRSVQARVFIVHVPNGSVIWAVMTRCQKDASVGLYEQALAGFVQWLAPRLERLRAIMPQKIAELRVRAEQNAQHRRTPDIVANLMLGLLAFRDYAVDRGALTKDQGDELVTRGWRALGSVAAMQAAYQSAGDLARRFLELVGAALTRGSAHFANKHGGHPDKAEAWGWRFKPGTIDYYCMGQRIGWVVGDNVYLEPEASFAAARRMALDMGEEFAISRVMLHKSLRDRGLLASTDARRQELTVRRNLEEKRRRVLHLKASVLKAPAQKPSDPPVTS